MNVRLHIDRLVIEGIGVPNRSVLQAAVEGELGRLIGEGGVSVGSHGTAIPVVYAPAVPIAADAGPARLGHVVANSIYAGVGRLRQ